MRSCIIVPCFNEEKRISVNSFTNFAINHADIHFIFVNDGSNDKTIDVLREMNSISPKCTFIDMKINQGKASAVREGMLRASALGFDLMGYLDADLTIPLDTAKEMLDKIKHKDFEFIFASRTSRFKKDKGQNFMRQSLGHTFSILSRATIQLPVKDTQCGAKFFKASVVPLLFEAKFISKWIFDVEIFFRFKDHFKEKSTDHFFEFPLDFWEDNNDSKVKFKDYLKVPYSLLTIFFHYRYR